MPRAEEAKQRVRDEQRSRILEAAGRVFARKGMAATMDDIAAEASVSHGLAYRYFSNKETIFSALVEQAIHANPTTFQRVLELPGTPRERLIAIVSGIVESRRHPEPYQLLDQVLSSEATPPELRELLRRRSQDLYDVLRELIVEGQVTGEVAIGDPDQLVRAIVACLEGLTHSAAHHPEHYHEHFPDPGIFLRMLEPSKEGIT